MTQLQASAEGGCKEQDIAWGECCVTTVTGSPVLRTRQFTGQPAHAFMHLERQGVTVLKCKIVYPQARFYSAQNSEFVEYLDAQPVGANTNADFLCDPVLA